MSFLKRKNIDDDLEQEEESTRSYPRSRDFKDLKPENKRKRKEPKKPWGKAERLLVLLVLILTFGISGFLALSSRSWKLPGIPQVKLPKVSLSIWKEGTIIIEGRNKDRQRADNVIKTFNKMTNSLSGVYGIYISSLNSGFSYGVRENEEFEPASLNKLPVILGLYMEAEKGDINLDTKYILKNSDKIQGSGSLASKPAGTVITYRELIRYMGKESDNTAVNISRKILGEQRINDVIKEVGMKDTVVLGNKQKTTPKDIATFFERIWWGGLISEKSKDELLNYLTDTIYEDWLPAGIPGQIKIAHKFGRDLHVVNDAGIVFCDKTYVIVVLSKGVVESEADKIFPEISKLIYENQTMPE